MQQRSIGGATLVLTIQCRLMGMGPQMGKIYRNACIGKILNQLKYRSCAPIRVRRTIFLYDYNTESTIYIYIYIYIYMAFVAMKKTDYSYGWLR